MSVPKTLEIPEGVFATRVATERALHAAHIARARHRRGNILLVPGWTGSKEDFTPMLPLLAAEGFDVVAFDQRGQYESPGRPDDDYSLAGFADDAMAVAKAAFRSGPLHIMGHSFGGLVTQELSTMYAERLTTISLVCSGPGALGDSDTRPLQRMSNALGKLPLAQIHEMRDQGVKRPAQITRFLGQRFTSNSPDSLKAMTQHLLEAPDIIESVAATGLPAWVARGATDDAWPWEAQEDMAHRLGTEIEILPSAAHSPGVEAPEELAQAWLPFVNKYTNN
ncbi:MAG: alpha/beta hydrolase [Actinomycetales bacterium]|nr:alpha/beta hydrolase [Actinomycetales bacterium]